jgi:CheY-like chemotaxis protein
VNADVIRPTFDEQDRPLRMVGAVQDITGRKQMEEELRQWNDRLGEQVRRRTEQLTRTVSHLRDEITRRVQAEDEARKNSRVLEGFFEHTITPLAFLDRDFNFVRVNEAYAWAEGRTPQYFAGRNHFDLYPSEEQQAIFQHVVQTKQPYRAYARPFVYPRDPQRLTCWNWQLTPLLDEEHDMEVIGQAGNGREAVDLACQSAPDVVIMDVAMPVMAGDEATRQIKRHLPNTRVITLSMYEDSHVSKRMRKAGAEVYLSKTGPSEELLAAIRGSL